MKKRAGLLLVCALLAALLLSGCGGQKQAEYRADVQSGVSYLQSLETIDPDTVTQKLRRMRLEKLQAERAAREHALLDDIDTVWQEFSDAVILGDSRAVGFSYYSFLDASRVLASSGERIDAIDGHIEDLKSWTPRISSSATDQRSRLVRLGAGLRGYAAGKDQAPAARAAGGRDRRQLHPAGV